MGRTMRFKVIFLCGVFGLSCTQDQRNQNIGRDLSLPQETDDMGGDDMNMSLEQDITEIMSLPPDFSGLESGMFEIDLAIDRDASGCLPGQTGVACPNAIDPQAGCMAVEDCVANGGGRGNGIDDDCKNGVDDGCSCTP